VIPRIIHQIWIGPKPRPVEWMDTWPLLNSTCRYVLWDDDRCGRFPWKNDRKIREHVELAGKADLMRYEILERFGGVFIDADAECVKPLNDLFFRNDSFACWENEEVRPGLISNGVIGACTSNGFMRELVRAAGHVDVRIARAWATTGPNFFTLVWRALKWEKLHIYPSHYFIPKHYTGVSYDGPGPVYADQHWLSTKEIMEARDE
jgi:mannosyltransferase OCH1-like enzyme